ncbi:anthranilate synthase component I [Chroococcidiopsis sp. FACHB-1243]|uniref:anthranilate synthase component I n=1 Tax=Chroococcidiopsis sp. [FACHB-1243] TaxID=2692781 RepID=UPI00177AA5CC|nr:anthranilate synthase component I [Chroococcidiopsis sp. [FACHB-1243]]MBD2309160.1 anthranilate synthase component I [Chroococcidiopsis sp. [FACHB-1243]]
MKPMQPWYWRSLPLEQRSGSEVFAALFRPDDNPEAIATLLESPAPISKDRSQLARYSICAGTPRITDGQLQLWTPPVGEILPFLQQLLECKRAGSREQRAKGEKPRTTHHSFTNYQLPTPDSLPFTGGWLGWLGYDLAWEIEKLPYVKSDPLPFPTAYWYEPECFAVLDNSEQILWLAVSIPQQLDELQERLENLKVKSQNSKPTTNYQLPITHSLLTTQEEYETAVCQAKKYIQAGDIFQANLSLRFETSTIASSWQIYQALQQINPSPFASYWQTPWGAVISCSPERLVQLRDRQVQTRPIAGTRSRGATPAQDCDLAQELLSNTKEIAEHIMLVDLERNDLGRVCEWGSVVVDELLAIERYSHVMHLVSNITGTLKAEYNAIDLIRAAFPGGTITGCPKVRCMEIIEELEPVRRSLFYGSCGYLDWRGNLDLNILIRTLLYSREQSKRTEGAEGAEGAEGEKRVEGEKNLRVSSDASHTSHTSHTLYPTPQTPHPINNSRNKVWGQVGAGIVADSEPEREWYESLHKAQAQIIALKRTEE